MRNTFHLNSYADWSASKREKPRSAEEGPLHDKLSAAEKKKVVSKGD
jgi:hypothetical protein